MKKIFILPLVALIGLGAVSASYAEFSYTVDLTGITAPASGLPYPNIIIGDIVHPITAWSPGSADGILLPGFTVNANKIIQENSGSYPADIMLTVGLYTDASVAVLQTAPSCNVNMTGHSSVTVKATGSLEVDAGTPTIKNLQCTAVYDSK